MRLLGHEIVGIVKIVLSRLACARHCEWPGVCPES